MTRKDGFNPYVAAADGTNATENELRLLEDAEKAFMAVFSGKKVVLATPEPTVATAPPVDDEDAAPSTITTEVTQPTFPYRTRFTATIGEKKFEFDGTQEKPTIKMDLNDQSTIEVALKALSAMKLTAINLPLSITEEQFKKLQAAIDVLRSNGLIITIKNLEAIEKKFKAHQSNDVGITHQTSASAPEPEPEPEATRTDTTTTTSSATTPRRTGSAYDDWKPYITPGQSLSTGDQPAPAISSTFKTNDAERPTKEIEELIEQKSFASLITLFTRAQDEKIDTRLYLIAAIAAVEADDAIHAERLVYYLNDAQKVELLKSVLKLEKYEEKTFAALLKSCTAVLSPAQLIEVIIFAIEKKASNDTLLNLLDYAKTDPKLNSAQFLAILNAANDASRLGDILDKAQELMRENKIAFPARVEHNMPDRAALTSRMDTFLEQAVKNNNVALAQKLLALPKHWSPGIVENTLSPSSVSVAPIYKKVKDSASPEMLAVLKKDPQVQRIEAAAIATATGSNSSAFVKPGSITGNAPR